MGAKEGGSSRSNCDRCGDAFDVSEWHPAELVETDGGDVRLVEFCSADCQEHWAEADDDAPAQNNPDHSR